MLFYILYSYIKILFIFSLCVPQASQIVFGMKYINKNKYKMFNNAIHGKRAGLDVPDG